MLRLTTFGGVSLRLVGNDHDAPVEERALPRRGLAMLVLLAAGQEAGISRDSVVAYLWPESDDERARNALRQTLFTLRRDLGVSDLVVGGAGLTLNSSELTSDVREFDLARTAGDLERVARLYGGPFLDGFHVGGAPEFERWVDRQRAEYTARATGAFESLARRAGERGEAESAAEWWRRLAAMDPLNTRFVLELMAAQVASGNPAGALRQAQAHEALMRQELGAAPDRALADLVARIRGGATSTGQVPAPQPGVVAPASRPVRAERFRDLLARELADRFVLAHEPEVGRDGTIRLIHAQDRRHDRQVTLKVLHPALASQIDVERFVREIRLTGKLLHPHILPLLDSGEIEGRPWYATPDPGGETLRARLSRERCLARDEAVRLTRELADALGHAHAHGIVHRDVSPENVLLAGGHVLLTNLGVARALDTAAGAALTDTGMLVGTPAYMSPEQVEGARTVDARGDIYSLAAVLFEMLTGEPLFSGPTPQAVMAKRAAEPTPTAARLEGVPAALAPVVRKALAGRPGDRYASMSAFGLALADAGRTAPPTPRWWSWRELTKKLRPRER